MINKDYASPLRSVFNKFTSQVGLDDKLSYALISEIWSELVGVQIGKRSRVEYADKGKLYIHTDSPSWRSEILLRKASIIKKINAKFNKELITDLIVK